MQELSTHMMRMTTVNKTRHAVSFLLLVAVNVVGTIVWETDLSWRERINWPKDNPISLAHDWFRSRYVNPI